jgi:hypothetical protein
MSPGAAMPPIPFWITRKWFLPRTGSKWYLFAVPASELGILLDQRKVDSLIALKSNELDVDGLELLDEEPQIYSEAPTSQVVGHAIRRVGAYTLEN